MDDQTKKGQPPEKSDRPAGRQRYSPSPISGWNIPERSRDVRLDEIMGIKAEGSGAQIVGFGPE